MRVRPTLILSGRAVGHTRLYISRETLADEWVFRDTDSVSVNGELFPPDIAAKALAAKRAGFADVVATNTDVRQEYQFEFGLAEAIDLQGVDEALLSLIRGNEFGLDSIDTFIMSGKRFASASRYLAGIANYLYGVVAREENSDAQGSPEKYEGRYDAAVRILGEFDRPPAEAICGLVAFHYNQFEHAMSKTKSARVSDVSKRFTALLLGRAASHDGLVDTSLSELDAALSDSTVERTLRLCAIPLDGSAELEVAEAISDVRNQRPYDQLKLRVIAAEHFLAAGDFAGAREHADEMRHSSITEDWYTRFRTRLEDTE